MDLKIKIKLKKFIRPLKVIRGRHTELVSVYIPAGYDIIKIIKHLEQEQGTASNIKDAKTRNNVIDSLGRIINQLRLYKKTPPNGLAVFAGNISEKENKVDIQVFLLEPPIPLNQRIYRCDQNFKTDILEAMMDDKECYGLIVMDRREATIGLLRGTQIQSLHNMTSGVPGKFRAGGQSSQRFERLIEGMALEFYKRVSSVCNDIFLPMKTELKGIIVGGPGPTKESFMDQLNTELKRKVKAVLDITYTDESGLQDLVEKAKDILAKESITEEKEIMQKFFTFLAKEPEKTAYGRQNVKDAIELGAVEMLLLSEDLDEFEIEGLTDDAEEHGSKVMVISTQTREGQQLRDLGKVAAILRYAVS